MIYYLVLFYIKGWLPCESILPLTFCVFSFFYISKKGEIVGAVVLPFLAIIVIVFSPFQFHQLFILSVIAYILYINIYNIRHLKLLSASTEKIKKEINWRLYLRPLAVLLIINYMKTDKTEFILKNCGFDESNPYKK